MAGTMLDRCADTQNDRLVILAFWHHLEAIGHECTFDVGIGKELDRYHGIDQVQLERERRQVERENRSRKALALRRKRRL